MEQPKTHKEPVGSEQQNIFTTAPEKILTHEMNKEKNGLKFCFSYPDRRYHVGINNGQPYFKIEYFLDLPDELTSEEKQLFVTENYLVGGKEQVVYVLSSEHAPAGIRHELEADTKQEKGYSNAQARVFERGDRMPNPGELTTPELAEMLQSMNVIFYSGAGISMSGSVHGLAGLKKELEIGRQGDVDGFLTNAISNPEQILKVWNNFVQSLDGPPTEAHKALSSIALKLNAQIITENVDTLQENAGVRPIRIMGSFVRDNVDPKWLEEIDAIVTIGLSHDDRGFLAWYKEINPQGIIIAIDLAQPSYLGDEDFILRGDLQQLLPDLDTKLTPKQL